MIFTRYFTFYKDLFITDDVFKYSMPNDKVTASIPNGNSIKFETRDLLTLTYFDFFKKW